MSRPWQQLAMVETEDGPLELRRRAADDFLILVAGRVLMNSRESRSEVVLGERTCADLAGEARGRVLVGGLGMGMTLRAVLETVGPNVEVDVAELHPVVAEWCRGPLAELTAGAALDPRVRIRVADVVDVIEEASPERYDAIVLDLFEGPHAKTEPETDPLYGRRAIERTFRALRSGGSLGVWSEAPDQGFEKRLRKQGFQLETLRPGRGGFRHAVVHARKVHPG